MVITQAYSRAPSTKCEYGDRNELTDSLGNVVSRSDYEPFGAYLAGSSGDEHFGFTGQRNEDTPTTAAPDRLSLYYYGARFYDLAVGRFITADSWTNLPDDERGYRVGENPSDYNRYLYVNNNPPNLNDPTGHWGYETHRRLTVELGMLTGLSQREAQLVGMGNEAVDLSLDKWALNPLAWGNHFDTTPGPDDSRVIIAEEKLAQAIDLYRSGSTEQALQLLGEGLHALQDVSAHQNLKALEHLGSRADDPSYEPSRFLGMLRATREYLSRFESGIGRRQLDTRSVEVRLDPSQRRD